MTFSAHEVGPHHNAEAAVALPNGDVLTGAAKGLNRVQRGEAQAPRDEPDAPFDVLSLALSPDGHVALVGTGEEAASAHRYDLRAGVKDPPLRARLGHLRGVGVASDGALLVCARSGVGNVALWRAGEEWPSHMAEARFAVGISAAALSPDGRVAVLGGESGELETWALSPQLARTADLAAGPGLGWIHDLAFADDRRVLCASPSGLTVWDVQRGRSAGPEDRGPGLAAVAPVPGDDGRVVVGTPDGEVLVRTLAGTAPATRLRAHERPVSAVGVSSDGALAASVSEDGWLHVSALDGRRVGSLDLGARGDRGTRLAFRPARRARSSSGPPAARSSRWRSAREVPRRPPPRRARLPGPGAGLRHVARPGRAEAGPPVHVAGLEAAAIASGVLALRVLHEDGEVRLLRWRPDRDREVISAPGEVEPLNAWTAAGVAVVTSRATARSPRAITWSRYRGRLWEAGRCTDDAWLARDGEVSAAHRRHRAPRPALGARRRGHLAAPARRAAPHPVTRGPADRRSRVDHPRELSATLRLRLEPTTCRLGKTRFMFIWAAPGWRYPARRARHGARSRVPACRSVPPTGPPGWPPFWPPWRLASMRPPSASMRPSGLTPHLLETLRGQDGLGPRLERRPRRPR